MYGGLSLADREPLYSLIMNIYLASHLAGGFLGGYLVARVRGKDFIQTGTVTAVLAYIFEFVYNIVVEGAFTDIYAMLSLLIGGIIGAMFFRARMERERITTVKKTEEPKPSQEPVEPVKQG
jgi:predicted membrane-bound spermidine synthase